MANNLVENLGKELEQIDREYTSDFAGHSRLTRDIEQMERMMARTATILEQIDRIPVAARGADLARVRDAAAQSLELYTAEREAIARAQEVGPAFEQFSTEAQNANFVFARYLRHFAGKDRVTRDVALLGEMVEDLRQIDKRMTQLLKEAQGRRDAFEADRKIVRDNLAQYQKEIELVEAAQVTGTPEEQAGTLANLANEQFAAYQTHFAGEPRVSRRPALIMRIIATLKKIRDAMTALKQGGLEIELNDKNIGVVEDRLSTYESELAEIRKVRQSTPMAEIMSELGGAANKLFEDYRSSFADKPRLQADAVRLGNICDKLGEIRRQMAEMAMAEENEGNERNLEVVSEQLILFEGEYEAVTRTQASK